MLSEKRILEAKILIVDDKPANITLLERMLEDAGYTRVVSTVDPQSVCALHREHNFDLILLDLEMPVMDGFQVMEALKAVEVDNYISVLAVTGQRHHKIRALQCGAKDFVSKPFELVEVLSRVHNLLEVRILHEAVRNHSKELEQQALRDPLTGLANRRLAGERMRIALAHGRRNNSAMALVYLDLDGFKAVNDSWGHGVGDQLLKLVSDRLVAAVRDEDTVARLGGDEFLVALWHVGGESDATRVASKLVEVVSRPYEIDGHPVCITISAGVALYPACGEDADTLMKHADAALLEAKRVGKNGFVVSPTVPGSGAAQPHEKAE